MRATRFSPVSIVRSLPPRRAAAGLALVGLVAGGGLAVAATSGPSGVRVSVPAQEVHQAGGVTSIPALPLIGGAPVVTSASEGAIQSADTRFLSTTLSGLGDHGIPAAALSAYRRAQTLVNASDTVCNIDWALIAGIGRVESDHGRWNGNGLTANGSSVPGIFGIPLNGANNTARITDTDGGRYDRDTTFDRAVGPMQFIPGTWKAVGVDANGDGVADPQNITDAATATAIYLCSGDGDLTNSADLTRAILRYNNSMDYVHEVLSYANAYRSGVDVLPNEALSAKQLSASPFLPSNEQTAAEPSKGSVSAAAKPPAKGLITVGGQPAADTEQPPAGSTGSAPAQPAPSPTSGSGSTSGSPAGAGTGSSPIAAPSLPVPLPTSVAVTAPVPVPVPTVPAVVFTVGQQVTILAGNAVPANVVGLTGQIVSVNNTTKSAVVSVKVSALLPAINVTIPYASLKPAS